MYGEPEPPIRCDSGKLVLHLLEGPSELVQRVLGDAAPLSSIDSIKAPATLRARTWMRPPCPVNFTALLDRGGLMTICLTARRSA